MVYSRETMAWAAGLFEGEGCFTRASSNPRNIAAALRMTDRDVVRRFQDVVGVGTIYASPPQQKGWKKQWCWKVGSFEDVQAVAVFLWPWLHSRRKRKIVKILKAYHEHEPLSVKESALRFEGVRRALTAGNISQTAIAKKFRVTPATITNIKHKGTNHVRRTQLTKTQHREIRLLYSQGKSQKEIAVLFKRSPSLVCLVVNGAIG